MPYTEDTESAPAVTSRNTPLILQRHFRASRVNTETTIATRRAVHGHRRLHQLRQDSIRRVTRRFSRTTRSTDRGSEEVVRSFVESRCGRDNAYGSDDGFVPGEDRGPDRGDSGTRVNVHCLPCFPDLLQFSVQRREESAPSGRAQVSEARLDDVVPQFSVDIGECNLSRSATWLVAPLPRSLLRSPHDGRSRFHTMKHVSLVHISLFARSSLVDFAAEGEYRRANEVCGMSQTPPLLAPKCLDNGGVLMTFDTA